MPVKWTPDKDQLVSHLHPKAASRFLLGQPKDPASCYTDSYRVYWPIELLIDVRSVIVATKNSNDEAHSLTLP